MNPRLRGELLRAQARALVTATRGLRARLRGLRQQMRSNRGEAGLLRMELKKRYGSSKRAA